MRDGVHERGDVQRHGQRSDAVDPKVHAQKVAAAHQRRQRRLGQEHHLCKQHPIYCLTSLQGSRLMPTRPTRLIKLRRRLRMRMLGTSALPDRSLAGEMVTVWSTPGAGLQAVHPKLQVYLSDFDKAHVESGEQAYQHDAGQDLAGDVRRRREHRQAQVLQEERDKGHRRHKDGGGQALQVQAGPCLPDTLVVPVQAVEDGACRVGRKPHCQVRRHLRGSARCVGPVCSCCCTSSCQACRADCALSQNT